MQLTLAITGASGAILAREALRALESDARVERVHFVASENSLRVLAEELGVSGRTNLLERLLDAIPKKIIQHSDADIGAPIASGSHPSSGMIVLPCSMGTLAKIALGLADSLIARAADVALKGALCAWFSVLLIEEAELRLFADFLRKMMASTEGELSLLDQTIVFYASNLGNASAHTCENLPILVAGGGFRHAGHVAYDRNNNTPLSNLFVRMLHQMGIEQRSFGASTGVNTDI